MANTKVTTKVIADDAITSDKLASGLTLGGDTTLSGHVALADSKEIRLGNAPDAKIYHNGTHLYIDEADAGRIFIRSSDEIRLNKYTGEFMVRAIADGAVTLYHDNSPKIATNSGGVTITGTATATTFAGELSGTITSATTGTTQSASDNSTKVATTAYVTTAIANLVDSSPSALNTLNELAAALGDDANFSTTVNNSIAAKLPLAGGTMTGALNMGSQNITNGGNATFTNLTLSATEKLRFDGAGGHTFIHESSNDTLVFATGGSTRFTLDANATFAGDIIANKNLRLRTTDDQAQQWYLYTYTDDTFRINYNGSGADAVVIDTSENLTINGSVTLPSDMLVVGDIKAVGVGGLALQTDEGTKRIFINDDGKVGIAEGGVIYAGRLSVGKPPSRTPGSAFTSSPSVFFSEATLGGTTGNDQKIITFAGEDSSNVSGIAVYRYRRATGTNWTTDGFSLRQEVDNTEDIYTYLNLAAGKVGVGGVTVPPQTLTVSHDSHGIGLDYVGSTLPDIAGLFTSSTAHTSTAYGDLNIKARTDYGGNYDIGFFTSTNNQTPVLRGAYRAEGDIIHPATERSIADNGILRFTKTASIGASGNDPVFTITKVSYGLYIAGTLTLILVDTASPWGIQYRRYGVVGRVATYSAGNTMSTTLTSEATYSNIDYTPNFGTVDTRTSGQNGGTFVVNMNTNNNGTASVKVIFQGYAAGVTLT